MPQYTDPATGRKVQLPYGPGQGFAPTGQGQGSSLFPTNGRLRMPEGQQTMGTAGTRQFPADPGLPPRTPAPAPAPATAPAPQRDRSSSLQNLATEYANVPGLGLTRALGALPQNMPDIMPGVPFERPSAVLPALPSGGVGAPADIATGQPLGAPPGMVWSPEGRWVPAVAAPPPAEDVPPPPDETDETDETADRGGETPAPFTPVADIPSTLPVTDEMVNFQQRLRDDAAEQALRQAPVRDVLMQQLQAAAEPVTTDTGALAPIADAIRLANQRAAERQQRDLAARLSMPGVGLADSGAYEAGLAGIQQARGEANAMQLANLMQGELQNRRSQLQGLLGMAMETGDREQARNLEAELRLLGTREGQQRFYDDLHYRYDQLGVTSALGIADLNRSAILDLLDQITVPG